MEGKMSFSWAHQIWGCEVFIKREAQDKLEVRSKKCFFIGYPKESFRYLFYKPKDNVVFVAQRRVFLEREMISKEDSGSKIDLEENQESADEEPIVNTDTQQEVVTPVKPDDISLPIRRTSGRVSKPPQFYYGFHIEEDKINDSTLRACLPKGCQQPKTPCYNFRCHRQLTADFTAALEAQTAAMTSASNLTGTSYSKKRGEGNYKEIIQLFNHST
ncbi:hypothetical protein Tco_1011573 [Tanacetum coccineum]